MNATTLPQPTAPAAVPLSRAEKEKLLRQMYSHTHWIELIRLFGYQTLPMERAREAIKPLTEQFGKDPVAAACEVLVEMSMTDNQPFAKLKPHIRRMAFQILGPEPAPEAVAPPVPVAPSEPDPKREPESTPKARTKGRKPTAEPTPPTRKPAAPKSNGHVSLMEQYRAAKERHPNMLLLFRMGDFYELFDEDAETAHKLLGLTLTTRDRTISMVGFPHHQLEAYLQKLLKAGQRVAVCEPVEESVARGPIRREVTRVVTPGTIAEDAKPHTNEADGTGPVRQPRVHVLKQYETWLNENGLSFVAVEDVQRTTPAVAPFVSALDFIVLRGDDKLLVTVRPHLQAKHLQAIRELQQLFGPDHKPVRIWPNDGPSGWDWPDHPIESEATVGKAKSKRSHAKKSH